MSKHLELKRNSNGRDFVIGDLHGAYDLLMKEMSLVDFDNSKDRLFSVGDLIDRGPDSMKCLELLNAPWFYSVIGNHEELMRDALTHPIEHVRISNQECWISNGGAWASQVPIADLMPYVEIIKNELPYAITIGDGDCAVGICHAQPPTLDWSDVEKEESYTMMTWGRTKITKRDLWEVSGVSKTYHGHTVLDEPILLGNTHFIDTGAWYSGKLTMIELAYP